MTLEALSISSLNSTGKNQAPTADAGGHVVPDAYLDLLKRVLTGYVYPESANRPIEPSRGASLSAILKRWVIRMAWSRSIQLTKIKTFDADARMNGRDWPGIGYTMVGIKRLDNIEMCIRQVVLDSVPGDICECGTWRGGCAIFMRAVLKCLDCGDRTIWCADSFEGLPKPNVAQYAADEGYDLSHNQYLAVSVETVQENFRRFNLLDEKVQFLKGWFRDTLHRAPFQKLAVLRLDGDLYESTMDALTALYHKVSPGGFVIIDDHGTWPPCRQAVADFRAKESVTEPIVDIDGSGAYWRVARG